MSNTLNGGTSFSTVPQVPPPAELLDKLQVAELLGVCPGTVDNLRKRGLLRAVKVGSRVLFDPADVAEYIQRQKEGQNRE